MKRSGISYRVFLFISVFFIFFGGAAEAVPRREFLAALLEARGFQCAGDAADYILSTGIVTDAPRDLNGHVTRMEALRWCVQSLGLTHEARILSDMNSGFSDTASLNDFDRGCLFVAAKMEPALAAGARTFGGGQRLTERDMEALLSRVRRASAGLTLDVTLSPFDGLQLTIHREGVFTGVPKWRVIADDFDTKAQAEAAGGAFRDRGFSVSSAHTQYTKEWILRSDLIEHYDDVRRFLLLAKSIGHSCRVLPSVANTDSSLLPRCWFVVIADPGLWSMVPLMPPGGINTLAPLSKMAGRKSGVRAAVNAAFFAVQSPGVGYPIGVLRFNGRTHGRPVNGRTCFGWNEAGEAQFGFTILDGGKLTGRDGTSWDEMTSIIQGGPILVEDGVILNHNEGFKPSFTDVRHPRTAVGVTEDGEWAMIVVDGRNGMHSVGATIADLSDIAARHGLSYALNLDGGGSSEIIVNGRVFNFPSDGRERPMSYGIGITKYAGAQ